MGSNKADGFLLVFRLTSRESRSIWIDDKPVVCLLWNCVLRKYDDKRIAESEAFPTETENAVCIFFQAFELYLQAMDGREADKTG